MRLSGRCALITGASRGIGAAIARRFAREGCDMALNYVTEPGRDNACEAGGIVQEIQNLGRRAFAWEADVAERAAVDKMIAAVLEHLGQLDILVHNAGITRDRTLRKLSFEDWEAVLRVNLTGAFHCAQAVLEHMIARGYGRIIFISSVVGLTGNFGQTNYAASKAGLIGFCKSLAREVAAKGITVNCIAPGFIDTEMTRAMPEQARQRVLEQIPLGRLGAPEDVAYAALFLASEEASYITGHVLSVNGGLYM